MKTRISLTSIVILIITLVIISCKKPSATQEDNYSSTPVLPQTPDNYVASSNDNLAVLGRVLFYDKNLSLNNSVSCSSCHQQAKAFCDNLQFSVGLESVKTKRNSPSIFAKNSRMFWDGRANSLRDLVLRPIQNHVEMRFENLKALSEKISKIQYYPSLFAKAFPNNNRIDSTNIQLALTEFLRNFNFSNNKFARSRKNQGSLNASEQLGETIFFNKGKCSECHHIESNSFPGIDSISGGYGRTDESHNIGLDLVYGDNGIGSILNMESQNGSFMVPALLNVEFTAPYMHDGRFKTLEEVVEHYNSGIKNHPNLDFNLKNTDKFNNMTESELLKLFDINKNGFIEEFELASIEPVRLGLTTAEKKGLVDFLKTLSDPNIFIDKKFGNPFEKN